MNTRRDVLNAFLRVQTLQARRDAHLAELSKIQAELLECTQSAAAGGVQPEHLAHVCELRLRVQLLQHDADADNAEIDELGKMLVGA